MSSLEPEPHTDDVPMPRGIPAMWRLCKLGYQHEPWLLVAALVLSLLAAVPDVLLALWLALLGAAIIHHHDTAAIVFALAMGASATATWLLRTVSTRIQRRFRDKVTIALESHVAGLQASIATVAHQERPDYLDRLSVLRNQVFVLDHMYMSLFTTAGWILRLALTVGLLASISPTLILLAVFALPTVATSSWRPGVERAAEERVARHDRLSRHLFVLATTAASGKEVRVTGIGDAVAARRRAEWERYYQPMASTRWATAWWHALAWAVFGAAYAVAVASVIHRSVASVLLVLAAGARLSAYVSGAVGEIGFLRGIWLDGSKRLVWLERYAASVVVDADQPAPESITEGIRLDHVSFRYPGSDRVVLDDVDLHLPAGAVVAIVGENGAGKSTLVKLLCKMYDATAGEIYVDDLPLRRIDPEAWRSRVAGAFQDFFRFEFRARQTVGVGDLPRSEDEQAVAGAVTRAGADDVVQRLVAGLDTQLGPTWPEGVDVSFGQWQKLALARGFMRDAPLLLVLDEPTAALDAETEHALFERYASAARRGTRHAATANGSAAGDREEDEGRITILVSHRFSTVRMADLIVVLEGAHVVEVGTHDALMAKGGQYAELYGIQAAAYR